MSRIWSAVFEFNAAALRRVNPVYGIVEQVKQLLGKAHVHHAGQLQTIVMELYNNALDHGILGLDSSLKKTKSGFMQYYQERQQRLEQLERGVLIFEFTECFLSDQHYLEINVSDSGPGYAWLKPETIVLPTDKTAFCGRGLVIIRELCETIEVLPPGNHTRALYNLDAHEAGEEHNPDGP